MKVYRVGCIDRVYHLRFVSERLAVAVKQMSEVVGGGRTAEMPYITAVVLVVVMMAVAVSRAVAVIGIGTVVVIVVVITMMALTTESK